MNKFFTALVGLVAVAVGLQSSTSAKYGKNKRMDGHPIYLFHLLETIIKAAIYSSSLESSYSSVAGGDDDSLPPFIDWTTLSTVWRHSFHLLEDEVNFKETMDEEEASRSYNNHLHFNKESRRLFLNNMNHNTRSSLFETKEKAQLFLTIVGLEKDILLDQLHSFSTSSPPLSLVAIVPQNTTSYRALYFAAEWCQLVAEHRKIISTNSPEEEEEEASNIVSVFTTSSTNEARQSRFPNSAVVVLNGMVNGYIYLFSSLLIPLALALYISSSTSLSLSLYYRKLIFHCLHRYLTITRICLVKHFNHSLKLT